MNEGDPTDEELDLLASQIYWDLESGDNREAVQRLRKLIDDAFQRGADE